MSKVKGLTEHDILGSVWPAGHASLKAYLYGFILSIALTLEVYVAVIHKYATIGSSFSILALALVQLVVQLLFFLHFDRASKSRWTMVSFAFGVLIICILAFASLWIMRNLNYHMSPDQMMQHMGQNEGL